MAFKMFKREAKEPLPQTPPTKSSTFGRLGRKIQLTPTAMDNSARGEQRRTEQLQTQLREVSATAASAYDELDELRTRNEMLNEQVVQQKRLIDDLSGQLEEAAGEKRQLKQFHEEQLRQSLQSQDNSELVKQKNQAELELKRLRMEFKSFKELAKHNQKRLSQQQPQLQLSKETDVQQVQTPPAGDEIEIGAYIDNRKITDIDANETQREITITGLLRRVRQLELQLETNAHEYEQSLASVRNTILVMRESKQLLSAAKAPVETSAPVNDNRGFYDEPETCADGEDHNGDTFVMSNLSFLK